MTKQELLTRFTEPERKYLMKRLPGGTFAVILTDEGEQVDIYEQGKRRVSLEPNGKVTLWDDGDSEPLAVGETILDILP